MYSFTSKVSSNQGTTTAKQQVQHDQKNVPARSQGKAAYIAGRLKTHDGSCPDHGARNASDTEAARRQVAGGWQGKPCGGRGQQEGIEEGRKIGGMRTGG